MFKVMFSELRHKQSTYIIAKSLLEVDPEHHGAMKRAGLLTRNSRMKERYKYNFKKNSRAPQFSKI